MATLEGIAALTDAEAKAKVVELKLESKDPPRHTLMKAYAASGQLAVRDRFFVDVFEHPNWGGSMFVRLLEFSNIKYIKADELGAMLKPILAALTPEERALYYVFRTMISLNVTVSDTWNEMSTQLLTLPESRQAYVNRKIKGYDIAVMIKELPGIEWDRKVTEESKISSGLGLLVDLLLASPETNLWQYETLRLMNSDRSLSRTEVAALSPEERQRRSWRLTLADASHQISAHAYVAMRGYYFSVKETDTITAELYQANWPGAVVPNVSNLISGVIETLTAYLSREEVNLVPAGQTYLFYVLRVLHNYKTYNHTGLVLSDLLPRDPVFDYELRPTFPPGGAGTAEVPSDAIILQRLQAL